MLDRLRLAVSTSIATKSTLFPSTCEVYSNTQHLLYLLFADQLYSKLFGFLELRAATFSYYEVVRFGVNRSF